MPVKNSFKDNSQPLKCLYPLQKVNINANAKPCRLILPQIVHSKNPYKIKKFEPSKSFLSRKPQRLTGFFILKFYCCDLPKEIVSANLSGINFNDVATDDLAYFVNLTHLNLNENQIQLNLLANFPNLRELNLCDNQITKLNLSNIEGFQKLEKLDLSFNFIDFQFIEQLRFLPQLIQLVLAGNNLKELPEDISFFNQLELLDLSSNQFSSNHKASEFWGSLGVLPVLKQLVLSRNQIRGIHTQKLVAGNFGQLQSLNMSFNNVDNQHNLICARNFKNLEELIITGNPFALTNDHKGLELEVYARTGAQVINEEIGQFYLKEQKERKKPPIYFSNLFRLKEHIITKDNRTNFFGVDLPKYSEEIVRKSPKQSEKAESDQNLEGSKESEQEEQQQDKAKFFITEDYQNFQDNQQKSEDLNPQKSENNQQIYYDFCGNYQEFKKKAQELFGNQKEYGDPLELTTAYKVLKEIIKKPENIEFNQIKDPHYMKPTIKIKRYKFEDDISHNLISDDQNKLSIKSMQRQKDNEMKYVENILDEINKKLKKEKS